MDGYTKIRSPQWEINASLLKKHYNLTQEVIDLLVEYNFDYDSSMMADDIPYVLKTNAGELIEIPVHWGTDDWPPFAHYDEIGYMMPVRSPSAGLAGFWEEFDAQYDAGGFFMLIVHPFLTGRLARWKMVEQWLEKTLNCLTMMVLSDKKRRN